jgi:hypothetical protein
MKRELWPRLYHLVHSAGTDVRQKSVTYQPHIIALVLLWAALHDRPMSWACREANWATTALRPAGIPSEATMSKRLGSQAVAAVLRTVEDRLRGAVPPGLVHAIDGQPLVVGGLSHDPDARNGFGAGKIARGYKLDAVWGRGRCPRSGRSSR